MQEISEIKPDFDALSTEYKDGQVFTVHTSPDNQQLIMVTLNNAAEYGTDKTLMERMIMDNAIGFCEKGIQTETVFGLQDLPTVQEIVRKTIAKTRRQEVTQHAADMASGPVNGIFTCAICGKVYRNKVSWQNHLAAHNGDDVFMCGVCGQLFNIRMNLKAHLEIHIREERKLKRQQDSMYGSAELKIGGVYMPGDIIPKDDEKVLNKQFAMDSLSQSDILDVSDSHNDTYVAATEEVHEDSSSEANEEDSSQDAPLVAKNTVENTESEGMYIYACNICGEQYSVKEECERHLKVHTGGDGDGEPETSSPQQKPIPAPAVSKPDESKLFPSINKNKHFSAYIYACNVCGKQYTNKSNCKRHMMIHTDDRRLYECDHCHKRFSQKYEVRMHSRIHTGEKPFTCGVCGKNFTERGNWRRHTQIHVRPQEASPYRCGICCKGFFHPEKLQVHLQIHSGQRPFICTVCGRKVKKIGDMYRHLRTHTGEKPYKCQVCGKGFAQNGNLKDHMKVHTGEKPHICDLCGKDFARKILLKEHIKNHHKGATLKDLTDAALEEIERQEAAMEALENADDLEGAVVHEISAGSVPKVVRTTSGNTIVIRRSTVNAADEEQLLNEEQEMELQEVHGSLSEKELEAAHVLTVVQDGDNMVYTYNTNQMQHIVLEGPEESKPVLDVLEVQNT